MLIVIIHFATIISPLRGSDFFDLLMFATIISPTSAGLLRQAHFSMLSDHSNRSMPPNGVGSINIKLCFAQLYYETQYIASLSDAIGMNT